MAFLLNLKKWAPKYLQTLVDHVLVSGHAKVQKSKRKTPSFTLSTETSLNVPMEIQILTLLWDLLNWLQPSQLRAI
jgi:hypothetical protein